MILFTTKNYFRYKSVPLFYVGWLNDFTTFWLSWSDFSLNLLLNFKAWTAKVALEFNSARSPLKQLLTRLKKLECSPEAVVFLVHHLKTKRAVVLRSYNNHLRTTHIGSIRIQCKCHDRKQWSIPTLSSDPEMTFLFGPKTRIFFQFNEIDICSYIMSSIEIKLWGVNKNERLFLNPWFIRRTLVRSVVSGHDPNIELW